MTSTCSSVAEEEKGKRFKIGASEVDVVAGQHWIVGVGCELRMGGGFPGLAIGVAVVKTQERLQKIPVIGALE